MIRQRGFSVDISVGGVVPPETGDEMPNVQNIAKSFQDAKLLNAWLKHYAVPAESLPDQGPGPGLSLDGIDVFFVWWESDGFVLGKAPHWVPRDGPVNTQVGYKIPLVEFRAQFPDV